VRIAFGLIWLIDASLKWTPHFINGYLEHLTEGSDDRPGWLQPWFRFWLNLHTPAPRFWAYLGAGTETLIALALLLGVARKLSYLSAIAFSLMIWSTAEGFGRPRHRPERRRRRGRRPHLRGGVLLATAPDRRRP